MISAQENEFLHEVLDACDPASICHIGNDEIARARKIIDRESGLPLTVEEREQLIENCLEQNLDHMFGDGQKREYILDGYEFKGLRNMTDEELLIEQGHYATGDSLAEMIRKFRAELKGEDW